MNMKKYVKIILLAVIVLMSIFSTNVYAVENQVSNEETATKLVEIKSNEIDVNEDYKEKYGQENGTLMYWKHNVSVL